MYLSLTLLSTISILLVFGVESRVIQYRSVALDNSRSQNPDTNGKHFDIVKRLIGIGVDSNTDTGRTESGDMVIEAPPSPGIENALDSNLAGDDTDLDRHFSETRSRSRGGEEDLSNLVNGEGFNSRFEGTPDDRVAISEKFFKLDPFFENARRPALDLSENDSGYTVYTTTS